MSNVTKEDTVSLRDQLKRLREEVVEAQKAFYILRASYPSYRTYIVLKQTIANRRKLGKPVSPHMIETYKNIYQQSVSKLGCTPEFALFKELVEQYKEVKKLYTFAKGFLVE